MVGPLEGWKVLDLTQGVAGPYVTKLCSDYGADVIKVERPGTGDVSRRIGPFPGDDPHPEERGMFLPLNTGKRGVTLNLATRTGRKPVDGVAAVELRARFLGGHARFADNHTSAGNRVAVAVADHSRHLRGRIEFDGAERE